ncbi:DMSO/TMAO reductase YedYZ molybdopterin-dependent catalytic subunit [Deinobacterium chartae]|uniref:DMSO/TMAO reductase YedYZ molybdopterin-dependent catalytic subunit n=1 Tax=Deinobacterium chartae TaxID=521158 RepID=A0A841HXJ6_9DEIO|nr:molybdopterin-dependent oxidoreductase [Deinobacterium chartae]MBB6096628.1 DMSO/TMAO reductase YedYZ molybdopterin-dependent catalytic subunit [Deinobacterium chartae]
MMTVKAQRSARHFASRCPQVQGKHPALHLHDDPAEILEATPELLREYAVTPVDRVFLRNSHDYPAGCATLDAPGLRGKLELDLGAGPWALDLTGLATLPRVQLEVAMQCAGNGRRFFSRQDQVQGSRWDRGGVANVRFGGVPLRALLEGRARDPQARFLTATGRDGDAQAYEKSVPLEDALQRGLLAFEMNGVPLPAAHGGPLRLVMPGFFGTVNVKWLRRLTLTRQETGSEAQQRRYRMPDGRGGLRPCWKQPIKSVIFAPLEGEALRAGPVTVSGAAWNDGDAEITRVDLSFDRGAHWQPAQLEPLRGRYAWRRWTCTVALEAGRYEVWSRASDALGRTQPLDPDHNWNRDGYEFCAVDRLPFRVVN